MTVTKILCLLLCVVPCLMEDPTCGDHEYYDPCGSYCPPTCQIPIPGGCPEVCTSGCFCDEGYIRENLQGKCILRDACEASCRNNEIYLPCGTACPATCTTPSATCDLKVCASGCFCEDGYILDDNYHSQMCIKRNECPHPNQ